MLGFDSVVFILSFALGRRTARPGFPTITNFIMEYLNRIELKGLVGNAKFQTVNDKGMNRFSVATSEARKDKDGNAVIETTWFNVVAFETKQLKDLQKIEKGSKVHITGRVRSQKYIGSDGIEKTGFDILAASVEIMPESETLQYAMQ